MRPVPGILEPLVARVTERTSAGRPLLVGVTGSVAAGKSTFAATLAELCRTGGTSVEVVSTDGFLFGNERLGELGMSLRKGFPESFDRIGLARFLDAARRSTSGLRVPLYDHFRYDVLDEPGELATADLVIVEGLCLLGPGAEADGSAMADRLDLTVYLDANDADVERWFTERFRTNASRAGKEPGGFWDLFSGLSDAQIVEVAGFTWHEVNAVNLREHIEPGRAEADVIVHKAADHTIKAVTFRSP